MMWLTALNEKKTSKALAGLDLGSFSRFELLSASSTWPLSFLCVFFCSFRGRNWLAGVGDEGDGDADALAQEQQDEQRDGDQDGQDDQKDEPSVALRQIRRQVRREGHLGQTQVGVRVILQRVPLRVAVPHTYHPPNNIIKSEKKTRTNLSKTVSRNCSY